MIILYVVHATTTLLSNSNRQVYLMETCSCNIGTHCKYINARFARTRHRHNIVLFYDLCHVFQKLRRLPFCSHDLRKPMLFSTFYFHCILNSFHLDVKFQAVVVWLYENVSLLVGNIVGCASVNSRFMTTRFILGVIVWCVM